MYVCMLVKVTKEDLKAKIYEIIQMTHESLHLEGEQEHKPI